MITASATIGLPLSVSKGRTYNSVYAVVSSLPVIAVSIHCIWSQLLLKILLKSLYKPVNVGMVWILNGYPKKKLRISESFQVALGATEEDSLKKRVEFLSLTYANSSLHKDCKMLHKGSRGYFWTLQAVYQQYSNDLNMILNNGLALLFNLNNKHP
uniref:Uncharacterized protein n=1 Tax=Glossina pallidipes TaxID=7398 RepID=A0A1A9ZT74_GLOPL